MSNPLLSAHTLPPFSHIKTEHIQPAIAELIERNRRVVNERLANPEPYTWANFVEPLEQVDDELAQAWSPVGHLNGVQNSDALRDAYNACLPLLSQYSTEMGQNQALFAAYQQLRDSAEFATLNRAQQTSIDHALRDFRMAGVDLPDADKQRYGSIKQRLSELTSQFGEHVLDATQAWSKHITDASELAGLPDSAKALLQQLAQQRSLDGFVVTLDFPAYLPIMTYADNRALRQALYHAFVTRASEIGPHAGQFDNSDSMVEIVALRHELANLLGFDNYAEYSVATKMASSGQEVVAFLQDLASRAKPQAEREFAELQAFAAEHGCPLLEPWDVTYYSEKLRQQRYAISQEDIRPYLPINTVLAGLFKTSERLFGIQIEEHHDVDLYHQDVRFFRVYRNGEAIAAFYLDLYARPKKRGGAWMDDCRVRRQTMAGIQLPVAYLVCNFSPAVGDTPALLTHDELTTLFHEFGHGLHHMLTEVNVAAVSGINGVAWDAVELPSQFLENWCYEPEALAYISGHYQTGEPLPQTLLDKLLAAKNFQSAMMTMRQLEFSLFDFRLHRECDPANNHAIQTLVDAVRAEVCVVPVAPFNRFQHSFSHIFAGGYAAGYYSYKWAEVLSADAFACFEEEGIFNTDTGERFLREILSQGGSQEAAQLFAAFRGRQPTVDALLRHNGIIHTGDAA